MLGCPACSAPGPPGVWHEYGSREGQECALQLSMWPRYGTGMARDWEGMAQDIAAGLGNTFTFDFEYSNIADQVGKQFNEVPKGKRSGLLNYFIERKLNNLIQDIGEF